MSRPIPLLFAATAVLACGSAMRQSRGPSDVLTREEILASAAPTAWDAVAQLRPHFLHGRGVRSFTSADARRPVVYLNDVRQGSTDVLRTIPVDDISEIRYLDPADATTRHGTGHLGGVIEVRTYVPPE